MKYTYTYLLNNKEVSQIDFINSLNRDCVRCDTNYDNPLLNIAITDEAMVKRYFSKMKRQANKLTMLIGYNSYRIKRCQNAN